MDSRVVIWRSDATCLIEYVLLYRIRVTQLPKNRHLSWHGANVERAGQLVNGLWILLTTYKLFFFIPGYRHAALTVSDGKNSAASQTAVEQQQQQLLQAGPALSLAAAGGSASANTQHHPAPPVVRVTLASVEECNVLLHNGLDFYGATFFPVEAASPVIPKKKSLPPNRYFAIAYKTIQPDTS